MSAPGGPVSSFPKSPFIYGKRVVRNCLLPYTHFQYDPDTNLFVAVLFPSERRAEVTKALSSPPAELKLQTFRVYDYIGKGVLDLHVNNMPHLYKVIQHLVATIPEFTLTIWDGTEAAFRCSDDWKTFDRTFQERRLVDLIDRLTGRFREDSRDRPMNPTIMTNKVPIYLDEFWTTEEGWDLAKYLRATFYYPNKVDDDDDERSTAESMEMAYRASLLPTETPQ